MGKRNRTQIKGPIAAFVTTTLKEWTPLFAEPYMMDRVEKQLFQLFPLKADALMGYVLMPSHVHLLVGCKDGGAQLSEFMRTFKSLTARLLFPEMGSVWMDGFDDFVIRTEKQFWVKLNYIHENPVRSGLVKSSVDWKWSSARFWLEDDIHPVLAKTWDWAE